MINPIEANLKWAIAKRRSEEGGFNGWDIIKKYIDIYKEVANA